MRRLIVNADDFGLTHGVNRAIAELHEAGVLTSATLMARAFASDEAIALARSAPSLGIGCHVVLVDGEAVMPAHQIRGLLDSRTGAFHPSLGAFLRRLASGRVPQAEIELETAAQIARLQGAGLRLTHIDTHKHMHMFPAVLKPVLRAARAAGIGKVRNPFEPLWSVRATPGARFIRRVEVNMLRRLQRAFLGIVQEEGFATTDGASGVLATGTLDQATISSLLRCLPAGTWELVTHPGYNDADLGRVRTRLRKSREVEREGLETLAHFSSFELISFADL